MKKITIILCVGVASFFMHSQTKDVVHLSFNVNKEECSFKKADNDNGSIHFYIDKEHFKWHPKGTLEEITNSKLDSIDIVDMNSFFQLLKLKKEKLIKESQGKVIRIVPKNEFFNKIYLYERTKQNLIKKYEVEWVNSIID